VEFADPGEAYHRATGLRELTDEAIAVILEAAAEMPSPLSGIGLQELSGVASRVPPTATAFPHRSHHWDFLILSQWEDLAESGRNIEWARSLFERMKPFVESGVYSNNLGEGETSRVTSAYGPNYERLAKIKRTWDPDNLFRLNHNIARVAGVDGRADWRSDLWPDPEPVAGARQREGSR
jgi:hypothetical protein